MLYHSLIIKYILYCVYICIVTVILYELTSTGNSISTRVSCTNARAISRTTGILATMNRNSSLSPSFTKAGFGGSQDSTSKIEMILN